MRRLYSEPFSKYLLGSFVVILFVAITLIVSLIILLIISPNGLGQLSKNELFIFTLTPFVLGLVGLILVVRYLHKRGFKTIVTHRSSIDYNRIFFSSGVYGVLGLASFILSYYLYPEGTFQWNFKSGPFFILLFVSIILIPIQAGLEELLFRGYLMQGFEKLSRNRWLPTLITSLSFGLMHALNPEISNFGFGVIGSYIIFGIVLGICTQMDGGSEISIGLHVAHNLLACLLVTVDWGAIQTEALFRSYYTPSIWEFYISLLVIMPLFMLIMATRYKWSNWKYNLFGRFETNSIQTR